MSEGFIEFEAPCCFSERTCSVTADYIISLRTRRVLRRIAAVRCYRGYIKKYKFYPSQDVALVSYYCSNRGVHYISIKWKPEGVSKEEVIKAAMKALGLEAVTKIVVRGEEVVEEREDE